VVVQQHSRKLLKMGILMPETCWVSKKKNKNSTWLLVGFLFFSYHKMYGPINNNISNVYASNKFHQNSFTGYGQAVSEDKLNKHSAFVLCSFLKWTHEFPYTIGLKHFRGIEKAVFIFEIELRVERNTLTQQKHA